MLENQAAIDAHKANPRAMPATSTERSGSAPRRPPRYPSSTDATEEWFSALSLDFEVKLAKFCLLSPSFKYHLQIRGQRGHEPGG